MGFVYTFPKVNYIIHHSFKKMRHIMLKAESLVWLHCGQYSIISGSILTLGQYIIAAFLKPNMCSMCMYKYVCFV